MNLSLFVAVSRAVRAMLIALEMLDGCFFRALLDWSVSPINIEFTESGIHVALSAATHTDMLLAL